MNDRGYRCLAEQVAATLSRAGPVDLSRRRGAIVIETP
jgi:hypothetical protein